MGMNRRYIFLFLIIYLCLPKDAFAYLDPGTGSMLLQGLLAGVMVVCTALGIFWRRIKDFFYRRISRKK